MSPRKKAACGLGLASHLVIVCLSAAQLPLPTFGSQWGLSLTDSYSYISGSGYHFGFFAPGVASEIKVTYSCIENGEASPEQRFKVDNQETTFRLHNTMEKFWGLQNAPHERRAMAASFALKAMSWCPQAEKVRIGVQAYVLPSMKEARAGVRPYWENHYTGTFKRREQKDL